MAFRLFIADPLSKSAPRQPKSGSPSTAAPKAARIPASKPKAPKVAADPKSKLPSSEVTKAPAVPKSKEAQVKDKSPSLPKPAGEPKAPAGGADKQGKYGQPVQHVDKKRYPKRPNNAVGETSSTWVIPQGQKPMYNKQEGGKEEQGGDKPAAGEEGPALKVKAPAVSATDHGDVKPVDSKMMVPKASADSLLGKPGVKKPETDAKAKGKGLPPPPKDIMERVKAGKSAQLPDGTTVHSTKSGDKTVAHTITKPDGKKEIAHTDQDAMSKLGGGKAATPSAEDHRNNAQAAREAGDPEIAKKHEKLAEAKEKMAADKKPKKQEKSKEEKDIETADKEAAKFREKLTVRKDKAKAAEKKKLDKQKNSADEKVVKEAQKELKAKSDERKRVNKKPDSPEGHAAQQLHVGKAKESLNKVDDLLKDPDLTDLDKEQLNAVKSALDVASKQKHEPNSEESKKLNGMAKVVNHMHGNQQKKVKAAERDQKKEVKLKIKEEIGEKKAGEKKAKEEQKSKQKAVKEAEKAKKEAEKLATKNGTVVSQDIQQQQETPKAANKVGLGAFHSGRAAGEAASNNAAADSGAGLGHQAASGAVSGIASAGHKLLGGEGSKEQRYTVRNKKEKIEQSGMQSTVSKSLWHNDIELTEEDDATKMAKSLTGKFKKSFCPVSDREAEFLTRECGYSMERIQKGLVSVNGKLEGRYANWLCEKTNSAIDDLRGSFDSDD